jgi:hypothetical protein
MMSYEVISFEWFTNIDRKSYLIYASEASKNDFMMRTVIKGIGAKIQNIFILAVQMYRSL